LTSYTYITKFKFKTKYIKYTRWNLNSDTKYELKQLGGSSKRKTLLWTSTNENLAYCSQRTN